MNNDHVANVGHPPDRREGNLPPIRSGPAIFLLLVFVAVVWIVAYLSRPLAPSVKLFAADNLLRILNSAAYVVSIATVLILAGGGFVALWDMLFARRAFFIPMLGRLLGFGFPQFGVALKRLRDWNDPSRAAALAREYGREHAVSDLEGRPPFSQWMIAEIISKYENNVQGFAYGGAAILVFIVGLRGMQVITKDEPMLIIWALLLEFALIGLLGIVIFFKPEDHKFHHGGGSLSHVDHQQLRSELAEFGTSFEDLRAEIAARLQAHQTAIDELRTMLDDTRRPGGA